MYRTTDQEEKVVIKIIYEEWKRLEVNRRARFQNEEADERAYYNTKIEEYKRLVLVYYRQDESSKEFMKLLRNAVNENLSANALIDLQSGKTCWETLNQQKNKLLAAAGKGQDLLLTHLALKV
jgi:hypothetical protein